MGRPSSSLFKRTAGVAILGLCLVPFSGFASNQEINRNESSRISELLSSKQLIAHCVYSKKQKKWVGCEDENTEHEHEPEVSDEPSETNQIESSPTPSPTDMPSDTPSESVAPSETPLATSEPVVVSTKDGKWIETLGSLKIPANGTFSFREWVETNQLPKLGLKPMEQIASQIYRAAVYSGLVIGERKIHAEKSEISIPGFDVNLSKPEYQLTLWNPYQGEVIFNVVSANTGWELKISPIKDPNWKKSTIEMIEMQVQPTIQVLANKGQNSEANVMQEGQMGALIKVYRVEGKNRTVISRDYYEPIPKKMRVNSM